MVIILGIRGDILIGLPHRDFGIQFNNQRQARLRLHLLLCCPEHEAKRLILQPRILGQINFDGLTIGEPPLLLIDLVGLNDINPQVGNFGEESSRVRLPEEAYDLRTSS